MEQLAPPHPNHHSAADWTFQTNKWQLTDKWGTISPPYALNGTGGVCGVISNYPNTLAMPDGRLVTWFRRLGIRRAQLAFRVQSSPGPLDATGWYRVRTGTAEIDDLWYLGPTGSYLVGTWNWKDPTANWKRVRLTWWRGSTDQGIPALCVQLERWDGAAWIDLGTLYDINDMHAGAVYNMLGLVLWDDGLVYDNTEIWSPP